MFKLFDDIGVPAAVLYAVAGFTSRKGSNAPENINYSVSVYNQLVLALVVLPCRLDCFLMRCDLQLPGNPMYKELFEP
jgi:hypothetical protein